MKIISILLMVLCSCTGGTKKVLHSDNNRGWLSIFNGKNLDGWTPKVAGDSVGVNTLNVFRVEDGLLRVCYDEYDQFNNRYGHLFYKEKLSKYKLRVEYRFVGSLLPDAESFCYRNSGIMIHSQSAGSMGIEQYWPVSLETQLLGSSDSVKQHTANLCTPGTTVEWRGQRTEKHIVPASSNYYFDDEWVTVEIIVNGARSISHVMEGDTVLHCSEPQIGGFLLPENYPIPVGAIIEDGYIALQAEGQPVDFKKIELLKLDD
ncbi:3-keto-disaccharide hydrolase [Sunxiuqinia indica]|uniref:3-keto-disaccharide hydrolase n=1 Tax=Sunxiuqinia indica TaxID=2692584 RepID=UPI00135694E1|nr:DUF1080 domain-containing protein [Sunxiuqinia indica]